jgi:hypothetical protein
MPRAVVENDTPGNITVRVKGDVTGTLVQHIADGTPTLAVNDLVWIEIDASDRVAVILGKLVDP